MLIVDYANNHRVIYSDNVNNYVKNIDENTIAKSAIMRIGYTELNYKEVTPEEYENYKRELEKSSNYDKAVSGLIHSRYTIDDEIALINNILANPDNDSIKAEYDEYQRFRLECKQKAKAN